MAEVVGIGGRQGGFELEVNFAIEGLVTKPEIFVCFESGFADRFRLDIGVCSEPDTSDPLF